MTDYLVSKENSMNATIQKEQGSQHNNSADNSVFNLHNLKTSTNYITLNCFPIQLLGKYDQYLKSINFDCVCEFCPVEDKRHKRLRRYKHRNQKAYDGLSLRIELFLYPAKFPSTGITTKIFYPTKDLLYALVRFFSIYLMPKINFIELTIDLYTQEQEKIQNFLVTHLFLKYNRTAPNHYKSTYYASSKVKSKGMRCYIKECIPGCPVRLELMLTRQVIRKLDLHLPILDVQLNGLDLSNFFDFRSFDKHGYFALKLEKERKRLFKEFSDTDCQRRRFTNDQYLQLYKQHFISATESLFHDPDNDYEPRTVLGIYHQLKKVEKKPARFFIKLNDFSEAFFTALAGNKFL